MKSSWRWRRFIFVCFFYSKYTEKLLTIWCHKWIYLSSVSWVQALTVKLTCQKRGKNRIGSGWNISWWGLEQTFKLILLLKTQLSSRPQCGLLKFLEIQLAFVWKLWFRNQTYCHHSRQQRQKRNKLHNDHLFSLFSKKSSVLICLRILWI